MSFLRGTLAERIRAGGVGLGGVLVDVGVDTIVEEGKRTVEMNGKTYLVETALTAEVSIVYAKRQIRLVTLYLTKVHEI